MRCLFPPQDLPSSVFRRETQGLPRYHIGRHVFGDHSSTDRYRPLRLSAHRALFSALLQGAHRRADSTLSYDLQQNLFTPLCQHKILMTWLSFPRNWRLLYSASGRQMPRINEHLSIKGGKYLDLSGQGGNSVMNWRRNWPNSVKRRFSDGSWAESSLLSKQQLQGHTGDGVGDDNLEWVTRRKKKKGGKKKWKRAVGQDG